MSNNYGEDVHTGGVDTKEVWCSLHHNGCVFGKGRIQHFVITYTQFATHTQVTYNQTARNIYMWMQRQYVHTEIPNCHVYYHRRMPGSGERWYGSGQMATLLN